MAEDTDDASVRTESDHAASPNTRPWDTPLPAVRLPMGEDDPARNAIGKLQRLSQRGKLPGFTREGDRAFSVAAHGTVYDRRLIGRVDRDGVVRFEGRLKRTLPTAAIVIMALAAFPGVNLTHTTLAILLPFYDIGFWWTAAWYFPLLLLAIPPMIKQFRASETASRTHAEETVRKLAGHLGGEVVPPDANNA